MDASATSQLFGNRFYQAKQPEPPGMLSCRECNRHFRRLDGGHLTAVHKLTREEYLARHPGAPITCANLRTKASVRTKQQMETVRGRPRFQLKSVRGHKGEGRFKMWPLVCGLVQGCSYATLAKQLNRDFSTLAETGRRLGFSGKPCVYDLGKPFDKEAIQHLKGRTGLSSRQLAKEIGLPEFAVAELAHRRSPWQRIDPKASKKIIAWRDEVVSKLLATASKPERVNDRYSGSRILLTFCPDLPKKYTLLLNVLRKLRLFLLAQAEAREEQIGERLCSEAMLETSRGSHARTFAQFLPWAPNLMPSLLENRSRIQGPGDLWPIAEEAIAERWSTTRTIVNATRKARFRSIRPNDVRHLILTIEPGFHTQRQDISSEPSNVMEGKRGRQLGELLEDTHSRLIVAAELRLEGITSRSEIGKHLYPQQHKKEQRRDSAKKFLRRHAAAITREQERLAGLSKTERARAAELAKQQLVS